MRKKIACLAIALSMLFVASCGNSGKQDTTSGNKTTNPTTTTTAPDQVGTTTAPSGTTTAGRRDGTTTSQRLVRVTVTSQVAESDPTRRSDRDSNAGEDAGNRVSQDPVNRDDAPPLTEWKQGTLGSYKLVWNDEFDKDGIDYNKWCYGSENPDVYDNMMLLTEDEDPSIITAEDGLLKMNARRYVSKTNPQIEYATNKSFSTRETMNFRYGYVEMRAMVPMRAGSFSAFWAIGKPGLVAKKNTGYYTEIDFFEEFGSDYELVPNFHKWYDDYTHSNFDLNWSRKQYMEGALPDALLEAARIDGAGLFRVFFQIALPLVKPALLTLMLFCFRDSWAMVPQGTIFREQLKTLPMVMSQIAAGGIARSGSAMAVTVILMIPPVIVYLISQSNVIESMSSVGIKE